MSSRVSTRGDVTKGQILNVATVQMDANPAPTADRLARAERLVTTAAESGADLIVLPELFNTGYTYSNENHTRVETIDGPTVTWLCDAAARLNIHLAGSLMLLEQGEVYNALLLCAPDGRVWRYDKNYPWGWERGSFRETRQNPKITVAETDLGNIGMLICWDSAHLNLWKLYAGRVDLIVICSCPPGVDNATYSLPSGDQVTFDDMGPIVASMKGSTLRTFGDIINQQTAWLGVPAIQSVGCGHIRTDVPNGRATLLGWVFTAPWLLEYFPQASQLQMSCDMVHECKIVDASGKVLTRLTQEDGEAFTLAEVKLAEKRPTPQGPQPASLVPKLSYFISDVFLPMITKSMYRKGKRQWRDV